MRAALGHADDGYAIPALLLRERRQEIMVTGEVVRAILRNADLSEAFMDLLLHAPRGDSDYVADKILETAAEYGMAGVMIRMGVESERVSVAKKAIEVAASCTACEARQLESIFHRHHGHILVTPAAMKAAAKNAERGTEMMELFLRWHRGKVNIAGWRVLEAALTNGSQGPAIIKLLLAAYGGEIRISERILNTAAQHSSRETVIRLLLRATTNLVTRETIESAARNASSAASIVELLLAVRNGAVETTGRSSEDGAHHPRTGEDSIGPLAQGQRDDDIQVTTGLVEAAISEIRDDLSILKQLARERRSGLRITERMVEKISYHDYDMKTEIVNMLLHDFAGPIRIPAETLGAFAASYDGKTMENLLRTQRDEIRITEEVVEAAAANEWHGAAVLKLLLRAERLHQVPITETAIENAVRQNGGKQMLELFLDYRPDDVVLTTRIVEAATRGEFLADGPECVRMLLHRGEEAIEITEAMVRAATTAAFYNRQPRSIIDCLLREAGSRVWIAPETVPRFVRRLDAEMIGLLLEAPGARIQITEEVVMVALKRRGREADVLLAGLLASHVVDASWFTEKVVEAIASMQNDTCKQETLEQLIRACGHAFPIPEATVVAIARSFDPRTMALLLEAQGDMLPITERVLVAVAENTKSAPETMSLLLRERAGMVSISDAVVEAAIGNLYCGGRVLVLLLRERGDQVRITGDHVVSAAKVSHHMLEFLLRERPDEVRVDAAVLVAAAGNRWSGARILERLFHERPDEIEISGRVLEAAARNDESGRQVVELLLQHYDDELPAAVVEAAMGNAGRGAEIVRLLFQEREPEIQMTEDAMEAAARNAELGEEILEFVLQKRREDTQVTAGVMQAAMGNLVSSEEITEILVHYCDEDFQMDSATVSAAAAHPTSGAALVELLLRRFGSQVQPAEAVLEAAAQNDQCGFDIVEMLLLERADAAQVTPSVVKAASRNERCGLEILEVLFHARCRVRITEEMIVAGVESQQPTKFLTLLLDRIGSSQITDRVVHSAARNASHGADIMRLLLDRFGDGIIISKDAKRAIAKEGETGARIVELLPKQTRTGVDAPDQDGSPMLDAMREFAGALVRRKEYAAAEEMYQLMLERTEDRLGRGPLGREHDLALQIMEELARILRDQGKYTERDEMLQRSFARGASSLSSPGGGNEFPAPARVARVGS